MSELVEGEGTERAHQLPGHAPETPADGAQLGTQDTQTKHDGHGDDTEAEPPQDTDGVAGPGEEAAGPDSGKEQHAGEPHAHPAELPNPDADSQGDTEQTIPPGAEPELGEPASAIATPGEGPEQGATMAEAPELGALAASLASLDERLQESQRLLARQSDLVDKLHAENQRLRAGELRAATLPLMRDLLRLHDDIGRLGGDGERRQDLEVVQISLLDALARNGITTFQPAVGEQFDPKQHSAAGVRETEDVNLDRSISDVIRVGFHWEDGQSIRVADVRVYKHTPPAEALKLS